LVPSRKAAPAHPLRRVPPVGVTEVGGIAGTKKAAGGVLTAKQAPHRPGTVAVPLRVTSAGAHYAERDGYSGAVVPLLFEYHPSEGSLLVTQNRGGRGVKLGVIPENLAERLALWFGIPPPGIVESWLGIMASRAVMAATKLDIFETLAAGPLTAYEIAAKCATHPRATEQLLNALAGMGCLR